MFNNLILKLKSLERASWIILSHRSESLSTRQVESTRVKLNRCVQFCSSLVLLRDWNPPRSAKEVDNRQKVQGFPKFALLNWIFDIFIDIQFPFPILFFSLFVLSLLLSILSIQFCINYFTKVQFCLITPINLMWLH